MDQVDFSKRFSPKPDVLVRELDGEAVILNLGDESYYGLNESGTRMWQTLINATSIDDATKELLDEYEVEEQTLRADLAKLIGSLLERKMVELT